MPAIQSIVGREGGPVVPFGPLLVPPRWDPVVRFVRPHGPASLVEGRTCQSCCVICLCIAPLGAWLGFAASMGRLPFSFSQSPFSGYGLPAARSSPVACPRRACSGGAIPICLVLAPGISKCIPCPGTVHHRARLHLPLLLRGLPVGWLPCQLGRGCGGSSPPIRVA